MNGRLLGPGQYRFGDVDVGDRIVTGSAPVTARAIDDFAALSGDRFEIHMSETAAARHGFAGRVAHGLLVLSLVDGLKNQAPAQFFARASLGWNWSFRAPVIVGDTISAMLTIAERRPVSAPDQGILRLAFIVTNQRRETVQDGENLLLVYR